MFIGINEVKPKDLKPLNLTRLQMPDYEIIPGKDFQDTLERGTLIRTYVHKSYVTQCNLVEFEDCFIRDSVFIDMKLNSSESLLLGKRKILG